MTTVVSKPRLGKRSPMGALVCAPCTSAESLVCVPCPSTESLVCAPCPSTESLVGARQREARKEEGAMGAVIELGFPRSSQLKLSVGQTVNKGNGPSQHAMRKAEAVCWTTSAIQPRILPPPCPISSSIDVPRSYRSPDSVGMDEITAAMVLTSLSCSTAVQSPPQRDPIPAPYEMECGGGELSDSGSSGYWSLGRGQASPAPSPSMAETDCGLAPPTDEGLDMELEQVLFDEPAPRKRKNSVKVAYRCLWPSCGKVLTSLVGMKRHIHTLHLGESEQSQREEDFYYTEIQSQLDRAPASTVHRPFGPWSSCASPATSPLPVTAGPGPCALQSSTLSQSAPGCFWQVHSEHLYQACAPVPLTTSSSTSTSCHWAPSVAPMQSTKTFPFRSRSVSVGEQWLQQQSSPIRPHTINGSPSRGHCASRKTRGEAKKCRKVYGIEHREQWCTACRWKKACQRFLD